MKKTVSDPLAERPNLDWSKAVRGKYADRMKEGSNIVLLDSDLTKVFPDSPSVNRALRALLEIERQAKAGVAAPAKRKHTAA
jgi:hypothetical protein